MVWRTLGTGNFSICPNGSSQWIWDVFGECAQDGWDEASVGLGLVSILCFAASTFPQYIKACKTGNMDQALSLWFLLGWIGGDSCNLIGSFLADQLPLQTYTAVYYVLADLMMLTLYFYYKFKKRPSLSAPINSILLLILGTVCITPLLTSSTDRLAVPVEGFRGRTLLSVEPGSKPFTKKEVIGFVIGSVSSVLYLLSRLPQIRTNFLRQSTQGISYSLFALVMLGNTLYGLSVLLKNPEVGQSEGSYLLHHLPWLVGSLGVLLLDTIVSFKMYNSGNTGQPLFRYSARTTSEQEQNFPWLGTLGAWWARVSHRLHRMLRVTSLQWCCRERTGVRQHRTVPDGDLHPVPGVQEPHCHGYQHRARAPPPKLTGTT